MEFYIISIAAAVYGFPALLLSIISFFYERNGNQKLRTAGLILFFLLLIFYSVLALYFGEYATYKRAGILYMFLQFFAFGALAVNAWFLFPKR